MTKPHRQSVCGSQVDKKERVCDRACVWVCLFRNTGVCLLHCQQVLFSFLCEELSLVLSRKLALESRVAWERQTRCVCVSSDSLSVFHSFFVSHTQPRPWWSTVSAPVSRRHIAQSSVWVWGGCGALIAGSGVKGYPSAMQKMLDRDTASVMLSLLSLHFLSLLSHLSLQSFHDPWCIFCLIWKSFFSWLPLEATVTHWMESLSSAITSHRLFLAFTVVTTAWKIGKKWCQSYFKEIFPSLPSFEDKH